MNTAWLERSAVHYLQRYPATVARVREVMLRRIDRNLDRDDQDREGRPEPGADRALLAEQLEDLLERLQRAGHLDDRRQARLWLELWQRRGLSQRAMAARLRQKGVPSELVAEVLRDFRDSGEDIELESARNYARRRRLGPYRRDSAVRSDRRPTDLAALARSGFSYDVARQVIDAEEAV